MHLKRKLISILFLAYVIFIFGNCATNKEDSKETEEYTPIPHEELYGTWINSIYSNHPTKYSKLNVYQNGVLLFWKTEASTHPKVIAAYKIEEKWLDDDGCIFYKIFGRTQLNVVPQILIKINDTGSTLEWVENLYTGYPDSIDTENKFYMELYRH